MLEHVLASWNTLIGGLTPAIMEGFCEAGKPIENSSEGAAGQVNEQSWIMANTVEYTDQHYTEHTGNVQKTYSAL